MEEVVEDGGIDGPDSSLLIVIIVSFNLGAAVVVAVFNQGFNHISVVLGEVIKTQILSLEFNEVERDQETIELFFLVSLSVFLNDDTTCQVLEKLISELT